MIYTVSIEDGPFHYKGTASVFEYDNTIGGMFFDKFI
jgi:hypothetical protein